jgi:hypothetical protein
MIWHALDRLIVAVECLLEQPALVEMEIAYSVAAMNRIAKSLGSSRDMPFTEIAVQRYRDDIRRLECCS